MFARGYNVFNVAQVDGYTVPALPLLPAAERIGQAVAFFTAIGAEVRYGGNPLLRAKPRPGFGLRQSRSSAILSPTMPPWRTRRPI